MSTNTLLTPDIFLSAFKNDIPALKLLLKCIFPDTTLSLSNLLEFKQKMIYPYNNNLDYSLIVYAEDTTGKLYDIDLVIADKNTHKRQARIHADCLIYCGRFNQFNNVESYTVMLSDKDLLHVGPQDVLSNIEWVCRETGTHLPDADHIIYMNGAYEDDKTDVGKLIHDLKETNPDKMHFPELRKAFKTAIKTFNVNA